MTVFDRMTTRNTGMNRLDDFEDRLTSRETGEFKPYQTSHNVEHELTLTVGVKFWANQAQYNDCYRAARRCLLDKLYGDNILMHVNRAVSAIHSGSREELLIELLRIKDHLTKD